MRSMEDPTESSIATTLLFQFEYRFKAKRYLTF